MTYRAFDEFQDLLKDLVIQRRFGSAEQMDKARNLLQTACEEDREDLIDLTEAIDNALAEGDPAHLQKSTDELAELMFFLET